MLKYDTYRLDRSDFSRQGEYGEMWHSREMKPGAALRQLIEFEFNYGGLVSKIESNKLVVKTQVLSKTDSVIVTGTEEELEPIFNYIYLCAMMNSDKDAGMVFDQYEGTSIGEKLRRPLFLTTVGIMHLGSLRAFRGMVAFLSENEEDVAFFKDLPSKTLLSLIELKIDEKATPAQLRELAEA